MARKIWWRVITTQAPLFILNIYLVYVENQEKKHYHVDIWRWRITSQNWLLQEDMEDKRIYSKIFKQLVQNYYLGFPSAASESHNY